MHTAQTMGLRLSKLIVLRFSLLCSFAILYISCGLLRKVEKEVSTNSQEQRLSVRSDSIGITQLHSTALYLKHQTENDSSGYRLEIWPIGKFMITPEGAFVGEAQRISLRGQHRKTSNTSQLRQQDEVKSSLNSLIKKETQHTKILQKQVIVKKNPAWKWALVVLGLLILLYVLTPNDVLSDLYK